MPRITIDQFAELTALISAAGLDGALWSDVMDHMAVVSGGIRAHIFGQDLHASKVLIGAVSHVDPDHLRSYFEYYQYINPKIPRIGELPVGVATYSVQVLPKEEMRQTEYYNDWMAPQEDAYGGGGPVLFRGQDRFFFIGADIRAKDRPALEDDWVRLVTRITPHLQHALEVNRLLDGRRLDGLLVPEAGGFGASAVLVLSISGRMLHLNDRAETLLASGAMLQHAPNGRLRIAGSGGRLLAEALDCLAKGHPGADRIFTLQAGVKETWQVRTMAFDPRHIGFSPFGLVWGLNERCLLVVLREAPVDDKVEERLVTLIGLTPAEARLAVGLAAGHDLSELAERHNRSIHTIRNQVKSALWKAQVRRQADLVGLVERLRRQ